MADPLAQRWFDVFMTTVRSHEASTALRDASQSGQLRKWTQALTGVVVGTFQSVGWKGAAKGHRSDLLPVPREEYLALDAVAFPSTEAGRWQFPIAVFELENSLSDDFVAYSLWKVLCVRAGLRVVFCYRRDASEGAELVRHLGEQVVRPMDIGHRTNLGGETMVIVGSRSETDSFPYGFFKDWSLDLNTARFGRT